MTGSQPTTACRLTWDANHAAAACPLAFASICAWVGGEDGACRPWWAAAGVPDEVSTAADPAAAATTTIGTTARATRRDLPILPWSGTCSTLRRSHSRSVVPMTLIHDGSAGAGRLGASPRASARASPTLRLGAWRR